MRKIKVLLVIALVLSLIPAVPAAASTPPLAVHFEVPISLGENFGNGTFTATGAAVKEGIVCPNGDVTQDSFKLTGYQSETVQIVQVINRFICGDGSGEFYVKLQVRLDKFGDHFYWVVLGGTEAYANLHGTGSGTGVAGVGLVLDIYDGQLLIE